MIMRHNQEDISSASLNVVEENHWPSYKSYKGYSTIVKPMERPSGAKQGVRRVCGTNGMPETRMVVETGDVD